MTYPSEAINKAFVLLPSKMDSLNARIMIAAIGCQESEFITRRQIITVTRGGIRKNVAEGPAASFWQMEKGGGVKGVITHAASKDAARQVCEQLGVDFSVDAIWSAMLKDDVLGAAFARLLMWTDSKPLPSTQQDGWDMYYRVWRPGKPHPQKWADCYEFGQRVARA